MLLRLTTVTAITALGVAATGCADADKEREEREAKQAAGKTCPAEISRTAAQPLPGDVTAPAGAKVYRSAAQGKTKIWFAAVPGDADELVKVRDNILKAMESAGYTIKDRDAEEGAEAEAEFEGPHEGTLRVKPLCTGNLEVRYKLES